VDSEKSLILIYTVFTWGISCSANYIPLAFHFLPPTILWPGVPDKLDDVLLLVVLSFPSPLPKTLRSSNNLYVGTKGFGPAAGAGFLGPALTRGSPCTADPFIPLKGKELYCCMGLAP